MIPSLLRSAMRDRPFTIHGDGTQTRDFIHVTDAARALVRSLLLGAEYRGQVFNVGSGFARSINSVVDDVARFFPHRFEVRHESARPFDILASCADTAALRVALGDKQWMPWEGGLLQTIRQTQRTVSIKAA